MILHTARQLLNIHQAWSSQKMLHVAHLWDMGLYIATTSYVGTGHTLIYSSKAMDRICIASATLLIYCVEKINSFKYAYIYVYHLDSWTVLYQFHYQLTSDCQYAPWYGASITAKRVDVLPVHAVECEASLSTNLRCYFENISPRRNKEIWSSQRGPCDSRNPLNMSLQTKCPSRNCFIDDPVKCIIVCASGETKQVEVWEWVEVLKWGSNSFPHFTGHVITYLIHFSKSSPRLPFDRTVNPPYAIKTELSSSDTI